MPGLALLGLILVIQLASALFVLYRILSDLFLWDMILIPWAAEEWLEIGASLSLVFGVGASIYLMRTSVKRIAHMQDQLKAAAGELQVYVERQFDNWGLTPTERNVALLVVKGFSNGEIASLRGTSESTVKTHLSAVFRKSGLKSRQQLVSWVVEDLLAEIPE